MRKIEVKIFNSRNLYWVSYKGSSSVVYYFIPKTCRHWIFIGNRFSRVYLARKGGGNVSWLRKEGSLHRKTGTVHSLKFGFIGVARRLNEVVARVGYWRLHQYKRLNVRDYVEGWVGWEPLLELCEYAKKLYGEREKSFIATAFLTGGRVSEVLGLRKSNFDIREDEGLIIVKNMKLFKRYKKVESYIDAKGRRRWITKRIEKTRKPFPILLSEPPTPTLLEWLETVPDENGLLFPSPYKPGEPLTRFWAYKLIRSLDEKIPEELRERLGLTSEPNLHLWLHWIRSLRACCLVAEYGFKLEDLLDYFGWRHLETATFYAKKGWRGLAEKMLASKIGRR